MNKILDRVKKLMRLAEGTHSAEEAQSAMLMAQKLMAENGLDASYVTTTEEKPEVMEDDVMKVGRRGLFDNLLASVIARNFRCVPYWHVATEGYRARAIRSYTLRFVGLKSDAEIASTTYRTALVAGKRLASEYTKGHGGGKATSISYLRGFTKGLSDKFEAQKNSDQSLALAIVTPKAVQDHMEKMRLRTSKLTAKQPNESAMGAGYEDGRHFGQSVTPGASNALRLGK